jgi:hypothetical protein
MKNELSRVVDSLPGLVWTTPHPDVEARNHSGDSARLIVDTALDAVIAMDAVDVQQSARNS